MNELKRASRIFKVAYGSTSERDIPEKTSRCKLFWRFGFSLFVVLPIMSFIVCLIFLGMVGVSFLLFGYKVNWKEKNLEEAFVPITHWPKIRGGHFHPWKLWVGLILAWGLYSFWALILGLPGKLWNLSEAVFLAIPLSTFGLVVAFIFLLCLVVVVAVKIRKTEEWQLFLGYLGDVYKRRLCPIIPIEQLPVEPEEEATLPKVSPREELERNLVSLEEEAGELGYSLTWELTEKEEPEK